MWVPPKSKHGPHPRRAFVFEFPKARCPTGIDPLGGDRGGLLNTLRISHCGKAAPGERNRIRR
jgi:hypothetical protein